MCESKSQIFLSVLLNPDSYLNREAKCYHAIRNRIGRLCNNKKVRKIWFFSYYFFYFFFNFLSSKTEVNVPSKSYKQQNFGKKVNFCWHSDSH